jgi:hypothetical protein
MLEVQVGFTWEDAATKVQAHINQTTEVLHYQIRYPLPSSYRPP